LTWLVQYMDLTERCQIFRVFDLVELLSQESYPK
jgi:hypothetical protein